MRRHTVAAAGYAALTLLLYAPLLPRLAAAIPGGPVAAVDGWQHVWHVWWAWRALSTGVSPLFTPLLYHPIGVNLALHPINLSNGLLALPVTAWLGPIAGYNAAAMLAFLLSGLAAYALALRAGGGPGPSFVAGVVFAFSPYHIAKLWDGQLELVATQWIALFALGLLIAAEGRGWRGPLLAGAALAAVGYTSLYYLIFCAVLGAAMALLWLPLRAGRPAAAAYLGRMAGAALLAALLLAPLLAPLLADAGALGARGGAEAIGADFLTLRSANLVDFLLPSPLHPLWGDAAAAVGARLHPGIAAWNSALGYTALALAAVGAARAWARAWRWVALAGLGALLALGPTLTVGPLETGLPLPYRLLLELPGAGLARRPSHFVVLTTLALAPLCALGLGHLAARLGRPRPLLALALAMLLAEYAPRPLPAHQLAVHPAYRSLAGQAGALLVIPEISKGTVSLQRQLVHGRPVVGGFLARTPDYPFAEHTPGVRQLWRLGPDRSLVAGPPGALGPLGLRAAGITQVVVELRDLRPGGLEGVEAALAEALPGVRPSYADAAIRVYPVPDVALRPFAAFGAGWHREEGRAGRRWRWMGPQAELILTNPLAAPQVVALQLRGDSHLRPRAARLWLDGAPAGEWLVDAAGGRGSITMRLLLAPGEHRLRLEAPADAESAGGGGRGPLSLLLEELRLESPYHPVP